MPTDKKTAEEIVQMLQRVSDATMRPMMGEYILYVEGKLIGQINEGELFIKVTPFGDEYAPELERRSPYPGARPAFVVPGEKIADSDWLQPFLLGTLAQLPNKK